MPDIEGIKTRVEELFGCQVTMVDVRTEEECFVLAKSDRDPTP